MAIIKPFKAIRPLQDKVAAVVTRSYHDYSPKERELTLKRNPFSFLHIINPEFKSNEKIPDRERFNLIHKSYLEFISEGILIKDAGNSFYLYKIKKDHRTYCGLLCATSTEDYQNNCIKKHEYTLHRREKLFAKYLKTVKFNAEPVLMTYRDDPGIAAIMKEETTNSPEYEFTTPDRVTHLLWTIKDTTTIEKLQSAFAQIDALYIADGHHRSASSDLLSKMYKKGNPDHTGKEPYNYFMSYLIPESEIDISEFNRMVKGLNGLSREAFLMRLNKYYKVENKGINVYTPKKKHDFSMYLNGEFYSLSLRKKAYRFSHALSRLDTEILYKTILDPVLGIKDLRNDIRIFYGYGKDNVLRMKNAIDKGDFSVGFSLVPITVDELKAIADAGLVMPPKSTYIEPKLRSGLTIYELDH